MIGRKLLLLNNTGEHHTHHENEMFISGLLDSNKIKHTLIENLKKIEHALIWVILRTYLLSRNFINTKRKEIALQIKEWLSKHRKEHIVEEKKEVSKYIKVISEYRQKIKHIKHKIKEEEGIE
jgi:hypothetical protein